MFKNILCRSEKALGNDIIGQQERLASQQKLCIPLSALSRIENVKIVKGHFTKLWKARWTTKDGKFDVAIKQLKHNDSHLQVGKSQKQIFDIFNSSKTKNVKVI